MAGEWSILLHFVRRSFTFAAAIKIARPAAHDTSHFGAFRAAPHCIHSLRLFAWIELDASPKNTLRTAGVFPF
jgi:hypothetical protein